MALSIGVDVGGTKIAAGVVDEDGAVLATLHRRSPATARNAIFTTIADVVNELAVHYDAPTIGVGAAGFTSSDRNTMVHGTNLDWTGARIADEVAERTGKRVVVENDANAAGWAEARFGAAAGKANVLVITLGTFRPDYAARIIELSGGDANRISGKAVTAAAREDDPAALECYARLGDALGIGLADLCAVLDPEVIVLAGGLTEAGDILLTPVRKSFTQHLTARIHRPAIPVIISSAGQEAGLIGAADLARQD